MFNWRSHTDFSEAIQLDSLRCYRRQDGTMIVLATNSCVTHSLMALVYSKKHMLGEISEHAQESGKKSQQQ